MVLIPQHTQELLELSRISGAVMRRKVPIMIGVSIAMLLTIFYIYRLPNMYRAEAKIVIEGDKERTIPVEKVAQSISPGALANNTQAAILKSRILAESTLSRLGVTRLPRREKDIDITAQSDISLPSREALITQFLGGLSVFPSEQSYVVTLEYVSRDPEFAATALNTLIEGYLEDQRHDKNTTTHNATHWLSNRVEDMRNKVVDSENRLEQAQRSSDSIYIDGKSLREQQLVQLSNDLLAAQKTRTELQTKLQQFDAMLHHPEKADASQFVLESPFIRLLQEEQTDLNRRLVEMLTRYRHAHPRVQALLAEKEALQAKKLEELRRVRTSFANDFNLADLRVRNITQDMDDLKLPLEDENDTQIGQRALNSEIDANKQLFGVLLSRYKETDVQDEVLLDADARFISRAFPPSAPFEPKRTPALISMLILSTITAVGLSIIVEFTAAGYQHSRQLEHETGLEVAATIPEFLNNSREINHLQVLDITQEPLYSESIRNLRTALFDNSETPAPKVLLISSSLPEEGKSSTSLSLAAILQMGGRSVILIDADMRRSQLGKSLKQENAIGLGEYLTGKALAKDIIYKDKQSGIYFIPSGNVGKHPLDALEHPKLAVLMEALKKQFDVVLMDSPPIMSVRDALLLSTHADAALYMVRWEKTPRNAVLDGIKMLREKCGAKPFTLALSRIELKKQRYYSHTKDDYIYFTNYAFTPNQVLKG